MTFSIVSVDPGVSTGVVAARVEDDGSVVIDHFEQFVCDSHEDTVFKLLKRIRREENWCSTEIVSEQFDLRPGNKFRADLTPVKVNAVLDYVHGDIVSQTPAQAKGLVKDQVLKNLGWWPTGKTVGQRDANDVRDAFRHLVYRLVRQYKNQWVLEKGWPK